MADGAFDAVVLLSQGRVQDFNRAFADLCRQVGSREEPLVGTPIGQILEESSASKGRGTLQGPEGTLPVDLRRVGLPDQEMLVVRDWLPVHPGPGEVAQALASLETRVKGKGLSPRELQIAQGLLEGQSRFYIASNLVRSPRTSV